MIGIIFGTFVKLFEWSSSDSIEAFWKRMSGRFFSLILSISGHVLTNLN